MPTLSLTFKIEDKDGGFKTLQLDAESFKRVIADGAKAARSLGSEIAKYSSMSMVFNAVNESVSAINSAVQNLSAAYAVQQQVETQLAAVMRERMLATEEDIQAVKDLCSAQQELGVIGDEVQLAGAQQLATFVSERATLETLIPVMNNYVAQHAGLKASAADATSAATVLGKAMTGNTTALQKMGIRLTEAQTEIMSMGTESQKAAMLVEIFTARYGNMNQELANTSSGQIKQMENAIGDAKEELGKFAQKITPTISALANVTIAIAGMLRLGASIKGAYTAIKSLNLAQKIYNASLIVTSTNSTAAIAATTALNAKYGLTPGLLGKIAIAYNQATLAGKLFMATCGATIAVFAVMSIASAFTTAAEDCAKAVDRMSESQRSAKLIAEQLAKAEGAATEAATSAKLQIEDHIKKIKNFNGTKSQEKKLLDELRGAYSGVMGDFKDLSSWYTALTKNSQAFCRQMLIEAKISHYKNKIAKDEAEYKELTNRDFMHNISAIGDRKMFNIDVERYNRDVDSYNGTFSFGGKLENAWERLFPGPTTRDRLKADLDESKEWMEHSRKALELSESLDLSYSEMRNAVKEASEIEMPVVGSPQTGSGGVGSQHSSESEKTRLQEISGLIDAKKQKYLLASDEEKSAIQKEIVALNREKQMIETLMAAAERPVELSSLKDFDDEIAYQNRLMQVADKDKLQGIQSTINALQKERAAFADSAHVELKNDQITSYKQLNDEVQYYTAKLQNATADERVQIKTRINELQRLKEKWDEVLETVDKPADISQLSTVKDLQKAIQYYSALQQSASADEYTSLQKTINALQKKADAIQRATTLLDAQREIDKINSLSGKEYRVKVRSFGFDELTEKIKELQLMLVDLDNPPTSGQRKMIEDQIRAYQKWRAEGVKSFDTYRQGIGSVQGIGDAINSVSESVQNNGNAWQKTTAIVSASLQIYDGIAQIVDLIDMLCIALGVKKEKTIENVEADTLAGSTAVAAAGMEATGSGIAIGAKEAETEASKEKTTANVTEAASGVMAAHSTIPWVGIAIGAGMVAAMLGLMAALPKFADGGIAYGPTLGIFGEYAGASSNPEVVAPLNRLKTLIEPREAAGVSGHVEFEIDGRKLRGVLKKVNNLSNRS